MFYHFVVVVKFIELFPCPYIILEIKGWSQLPYNTYLMISSIELKEDYRITHFIVFGLFPEKTVTLTVKLLVWSYGPTTMLISHAETSRFRQPDNRGL